MPRHIVCLTFDFDTQSGFIARGMTTPTPLSRGEFGALARGASSRSSSRAASSDLVHAGLHHRELAARHARRSSSTATRSPTIAGRIFRPATMTREEEEADLVRANEAICALTGTTARGYRSPSWDLSEHTIDLLLAHGFLYD